MKVLLSSLVVALSLVSTPTQAVTITQIVAANGGTFDNNGRDYDILLKAVVTAGLADALNDPAANLTVFAPNDRAFIRLARDLGYTGSDEQGSWNFLVQQLTALGNGNPIPVLQSILLYHVSPEVIRPINLVFLTIHKMNIPTLQGSTIRPAFFRLIDNEPDLQNPSITGPLNIQADNGIIHTIDRVLIPVNLP
jgi:serralysin